MGVVYEAVENSVGVGRVTERFMMLLSLMG
jgi:hypothetical protein